MIKLSKLYSAQTKIYILLALLPILILVLVLELWKADIRIPFVYTLDAFFELMSIKSVLDNGWYTENKFIGTPFGLELYDIPPSDGFSYIVLKLIGSFSNVFIAHNIFFILTFPLTTIASFFAFRQLKISSSVSIVISILYTFIPHHFIRNNIGHLFLSAYYMIPLITLLILLLWSEQLPLLSVNNSKSIKLNLFSKNAFLHIFICIVLGSTGIYYAFFSCFFITVASISAFISRKDKRIFVSAAALIIIISSSVLLNLLPSIIYVFINGINQEVANRTSSESEFYGLKIIHLLLPVNNHKFFVLKELTEKYENAINPLQNENTIASLGIVGSIGFLSLVLRLVFYSRKSSAGNSSFHLHIYDCLAVLNIAAILYATIGGFSSIFALLVSPQIRAPNRISVFIAFFSLLAVALLLDSIKTKYTKNRLNKISFNSLLIFILIVGVVDQTSASFIPNYLKTKIDYLNDQDFVHTIEKNVPTNSMIFQLPYVPFPENPPVQKMLDYEHFRAYLHSNSLKWSYGVMKGRHDWQLPLIEEPIDIFLAKIATVGFAGIYIDRNGYLDFGRDIETKLEKKLNIKPIVSKNKRFVFFNIDEFKKEFFSRYSVAQLQIYRDRILYPIQVKWNDGFYSLENNSTVTWRWAKQKASLSIKNSASLKRRIQISMSVTTAWSDYSKLYIKSSFFSKTVDVNSTPLPFVYTIEVPPKSELLISFSSNAKQADTPLDNRQLFFNIQDFKAVDKGELDLI